MRLAPARKPVRALHIGGYWRGPTDLVMNMMLGLRSTGAEVLEFNTDDRREALDTDGQPYWRGTNCPVWLRKQHLQPVIDDFHPDVIICNAGGLSFRPEHASELRRTSCLIGIALSDPDVFDCTTRRIAGHFDLYLTNAEACVPRYRALGVNAGVWPPGTHEDLYRPVPPRAEYGCEVLIFGGGHANRVETVRELGRNFDVHVHGDGWPWEGITDRGLLSGEEALCAISSAFLMVVFGLTAAGHPIVKPYLFDYTSAGALVATDIFPAVAKYFTYGRELIGFADTADLIRKIRYYLDHPEDAQHIRAAGHERTLREYTWRRVWPKILALASGSTPGRTGQTSGE